jgi:hypothetical protein
MELPGDIENRIRRDFREEELASALSLLKTLEDFGPRIVRCAVFVAQGSIPKLQDAVTLAQTDWRDLIAWAEYDGKFDQQKRCFNAPFEE